MLFYQFKVYVHLEQVTVFFPFLFGCDFCVCIQRICKVSLRGFFKPVNVFNAVVWVLLIVDMIKPVPVFLVFYHISICRLHIDGGKNDQRNC